MASSVSVDAMAVQSGIACCKMAMHELQDASNELKKGYRQVSGGWNDKRFVEFSGIIEECCSSLEEPLEQLNGCIESLEEILDIVNSYEGNG